MLTLNEIFRKHSCDKGDLNHHYHTLYQADFESLRNLPITLLEVGIFKGESINAWVEYFPNAQIYCLDIFTRVPSSDIPILTHPRVHHLHCDSTDFAAEVYIKTIWRNPMFDIIIDDGLHTPSGNGKTFNNLIGMVKLGGTYYVEDVWELDRPEVQTHPWIVKSPKDYSLNQYQTYLDSLYPYPFTRHDFTAFKPDGVIHRIVKLQL